MSTGALAPAVAAAPPTVSVQIAGPAQPVYNWKTEHCTPETVPDTAARAFRDAERRTHLLAPNDSNWSMIGPSLDRLQVVCGSLFKSGENPNPAAYDDKGWIEATFALPGNVVVGLASNEWSAARHFEAVPEAGAPCRDVHNEGCIFYSITQVISADGGLHFHYSPGDHVAATLPYRFTPPGSRRQSAGFATVSNIIENGRAYYVFANVRGVAQQRSGSCLLRTNDLLHAQTWRAWDGSGFNTSFVNPYTPAASDPSRHICAPVLNYEVRSVQWLARFHTYVALFRERAPDGARANVAGIFFATSPDLVHWSSLRLLEEIPTDSQCRETIFYPSMMSDDDPTPNYQGGGNHPYLYLVRMNRQGCRGTLDRDLIRIPLKIGPG